MAEEGEVPRGNIDFVEKRQPKVSSWSNRDSLHRKNHRQNHLLSVEEAMAKEGAVGDLAPITAQEIEENLGFMIPEGHRNPEIDWTRPNQFTPHDFLEQVSTFEDFSARNFLTTRALEEGGYEKRIQIEAKVAEVESKTIQKTAAVERTTLTAIRKALREGVASHGTKIGIAGIATGLAVGLPAVASAATVGAAATGQGSPAVAAGVLGGAAVLGAAAYGYSKISSATKGKISSSIGNLVSKIPSLRVAGLETASGFIESELELTTRGLAGSMSSVINEWGLNRRELEGGGAINTRWGREWTASGVKGFVAPSGKGWGRVDGKKELYESWEKHITGDKSPFGKLRNLAYKSLGGKDSSANRWLARMGGFSTLLPAGIALYFAAKDAKKGYEENGILGGVLGAVKGYATSAITNRIIGSALMNPVKGVAAAAVLGGVAYTAHKVFDVRTQGNVYMQSKKESTSWMRAPGLTIASSTVATMRQRAISAIENSKYSSMKSLGSEAYMITAPRSRYASNTMMGNTSPMMSY
jgi:hypothetical protein